MSLWRLFYHLFGWDYIHWTNSCDSGISRVYVDGEGKPYFFSYSIIDAAEWVEHTHYDVRWLTCPPSKYEVKTNG